MSPAAPQSIELRPPAMGTHHAPIALTGPGTLELRDDGLHVTASAVANRHRGLLFVAGILGFAVTWVALRRVFDVGDFASRAIAIAVGVGVFLPLMRRPAKLGAPREMVFPWKNVAKITWDGSSQCLVVVIKGMKPSGGLYVLAPEGSPLEATLRARLER